MKKQVVIAGTVMLLVLCFGTAGATMAIEAKGKDRCIEWGYMWSGMSDYNYTYTWLYADGSFYTDEGGSGYWMKNGAAFALRYTDGCEPLYAGTKSKGFMRCTDGGGGEGVYIIKSTKKRNCEAMMEPESVPAATGGPTGSSPE